MKPRNLKGEEVKTMNKTVRFILALVTAVSVLGLACSEVDAKAGKEIEELIEALEVGEPIYYENLTIIPVYSTCIQDYSTLDEALDCGWLEISEVDGGSVPKVKVTNRSGNYIFIMGGEILTGCRQDRIVGRGVLLRPRARNVIIPVYCVEQGRWTYESETFHSKRNLGTCRLRAEGQKAAPSAQMDIWDRVSTINESMGLSSGTSRFQKAYESDETRRRISRVEKHMERIPNLYPVAIGAVIGVGGRISSVDIFANPEPDAIRFLREFHDRHYVRRSAIDQGFELYAVDSQMNVNALVYRDAVTHLAAFPEDQDSERRIPVRRR